MGVSWQRDSDAGPAWATWVLLGACVVVQLVASGETRAALGLVPAEPRLAALLGHLFLHAGALGLLASLLFAAAAGPWLEARIGRGLLLASWLGSGLAGAVLFALLQPDAEEPWLGASAAVAGWLGLLAVAARGGSADLLGVLAGRAGRLLAPGWAPAALWLGGELAGLVRGDAAPLLADAAGFAFGAVLALAFERTGLLAREAPAGGPRSATGGKRLRPEWAEAQLGTTQDPAVVEAYLAQARSEGRAASARAVVAERLREALDARREGASVALFGVLAGMPLELRAEQLLELSGWARRAGRTYEANAAMHLALPSADAAGAGRIARAARRSDPVLSYRAAERALADAGLGASERSALEGLRLEASREIAARGVIVIPASVSASAPAPEPSRPAPARVVTHTFEAPAPARALSFGEAIELAPDPELTPPPPKLPDPEQTGDATFLDAFHAALHEEKPEPGAPPRRALRVREAVPRALEADALVVEAEGRGAIRLPLTRIHAVALAGVRGLSQRGADKPVLLIDLCLSAEGEPELQVLRLRSDRFDPRRVAPAGADPAPLKALRAFVSALAVAAHAPLLPADDVAGEGTLKIFRDLATYQREVLGAG